VIALIELLLGRVVKDPLTRSILMSFIKNLLNFGNDLAKPALVYIVEASGKDISASDKFAYVYDKLKADFPQATGSFLRSVIESTYTAWEQGNLPK
jgi:hypothetical protein